MRAATSTTGMRCPSILMIFHEAFLVSQVNTLDELREVDMTSLRLSFDCSGKVSIRSLCSLCINRDMGAENGRHDRIVYDR